MTVKSRNEAALPVRPRTRTGSSLHGVFAAIAAFAVTIMSVGAAAPPAAALDTDALTKRAKELAASVKEDAAAAKDYVEKKASDAKKQVQRGVEIARTVHRVTKTPGSGAPAPTSTASGVPVSPGVGVVPLASFTVKELTMSFVDSARPTEATEKAPGKPERTLDTLVLLPADAPEGTSFPLVVFGHGLGAKPKDYASLLKPLASAGYVVAAPRFPVGSQSAKTFGAYLDRAETAKSQPRDLAFVIDQVLAMSTQPGPLQGRIDSTRIGAAGHSLGATTVIDLSANGCCLDGRVRAVVPISGFLNPVNGAAYFRGPRVPMLLIHGDKDQTIPFALGSALVYATAGRPSKLLTVVGGDHVFGLRGKPDSKALVGGLVVSAMTSFFDEHLKGLGDGTNRLRALVASQPQVLRLDES